MTGCFAEKGTHCYLADICLGIVKVAWVGCLKIFVGPGFVYCCCCLRICFAVVVVVVVVVVDELFEEDYLF